MRVLQNLTKADLKLLLSMQESAGWIALRSRGISRTADGHLYLAVGVFSALLSDQSNSFATTMLLAFTLERSLYWVLKNGLRRRRPAAALPGFQSQIIASDEFSFPSGHSSAAFLFSTLLVLQFGPLLLPVYGWAAAVAMSRVYLGVHFPTDTVVGAAVGSTIACVVWFY